MSDCHALTVGPWMPALPEPRYVLMCRLQRARVADKLERRPVVRMVASILQQCELRLLERCTYRASCAKRPIEVHHELCRGAVLDLPETLEERRRPRIEEAPAQADQLLATRHDAATCITGTEGHERAVQLQ